MNTVLWILQIFLAVQFASIGVLHFLLPSNLPQMFQWMYDLPAELSYFTGAAELAAAAGLILPGITKILTRLTPLAALGVVILMIGAVIFHIPRGEIPNVIQNVILLVLSAFVAYMRWRLHPLKDRRLRRETSVSRS